MGVRGSFLEEVTSEKRARLTRGSRVGRRMEVQPAGAACAKALGWREQSPSEKGRTGEAGAQSERGRGCWGAAGHGGFEVALRALAFPYTRETLVFALTQPRTHIGFA